MKKMIFEDNKNSSISKLLPYSFSKDASVLLGFGCGNSNMVDSQHIGL